MHKYSELITRCTSFTLTTLSEAYEKTTTALQTSGATPLVKTLQVIQLQKAIMVIGMFSLFEAMLQDELKCRDGFKEAKIILKENNSSDLCDKLVDLELSINVLKHGKGKSYSALIAKNGGTLKHYIKELNLENYEEDNVSEINTLIDVDDNFVNYCSEIILQVAEVIKESNPAVNL